MRRARSFWGSLAVLLFTGFACSEDESAPVFIPRLDSTHALSTAGTADEGDVVNPHLPDGFRASVERYLVPEFLCVRQGGTLWTELPEAAVYPGEPTFFDVVYPPQGASDENPLLLHLHGSGLEFMEALGVSALKKFPEVAKAVGISQEGGTIDTEQTTQEWSAKTLHSSEAQPFVAEALRRGYTIVFPANCWGDVGHGEGEVVHGFLKGPRYGALFDRQVWDWAKKNVPHRGDSEFDLSCSGGGHRTAEMLIRDPGVFDAVVVDSPADYLPGLLEEPLPDLLRVASGLLDDYDRIIKTFFSAFFGGMEGAARWSLGVRIGDLRVESPIFLAYSTLDNFVTDPISRRLAEALADPARYPVERGRVWNTGEPVHCQIHNIERSAEALDWLEAAVAR